MRMKQKTMESMGRKGTQGTRKPRGRSGWVRRRTRTPALANMNAKRVPMFERSAKVPMSKMPAGMPTRKPAIQVAVCGVLYLG